jgi:hypothetical protein
VRAPNPPWKQRLEYAAIFIALGLLLINILLWCSTKKAAEIAREALVRGQRPWVGVNIPQITKYQYVPDTGYFEFTISFGIKNVGVSPALHVVPGRDIRGGDATLEQLENALNSKCALDSDITASQMVKGGSGYTLV